MAILTVGPGDEFPTISAAVAASQSDDTIQVQAGTYTNDFATIFQNLTIEGVGGMVDVVATESPPNLKANFTVGAPGVNIEIDHLAFSGAAVPSTDGGNGAGIRYQGGNLVLNSDYFFGNQDGMLADSDPNGSITINNSEFANNGVSDPNSSGYGSTHNLYVNQVNTLTIENSLFTDANVGHEIKSRALNTIIENNRIQDGPDSTASYEIDLPNGGNALIQNNTIEKGPQSQNPFMVTFGEEGNVYANSSLTVDGNTFVNDLISVATAVRNVTDVIANITNNSFWGILPLNIIAGLASVTGTTILATEPKLDYSPPPSICFCAGTLIRAESGEVPVEMLNIGDRVATLSGEMKPVRWIGRGRVPRNAAIIIGAGALADGVPYRDLHVTKGHSLYLDRVLVPAENLVNHRSIVWNEHARGLEVFHIELDTHEVLVANGAPAESYRDDGNAVWFHNPRRGGTSALPPLAKIVTEGPVLERIWRRLLDRAGGPRPACWTDDAGLHLLADDVPVAASQVKGGVHVFNLTDPPRALHIVSRSTIPAAAGLNADQRQLGVAVRKIVLRADGVRISVGYDARLLREGFHGPEIRNGWRWTTGHAVLPASLLGSIAGPMTAAVHVGCTLRYAEGPSAPVMQTAA